ncbi:flavodoxin family protein [Thiospirochaeta perfilievii]|uniref:flavodoxin family protein n=1 Tax=Thiospirochaeta perfilievii TaxID=252967 RepID=UPI002482EB06|nr:flavodoxin family protein [Thiospirochaeta perfilievii]
MACGKCSKTLDEKCSIISDPVNNVIQKMKFADGIILGSPVHYSAIGGTMKSFLDRVFLVTGVNKSMLAHKVGASVVAVRRSGGLPTFDQLNNYLNYSQMILPTSNYWNVIHGASPGEVLEDEEGIQILRVLGKNMAWLLKIIDFGKEKNPKPLIERKVYTNFIR